MVKHTINVLESTNNKITKVSDNDTIFISEIIAGSDKKIINNRYDNDLIVITSEGKILKHQESVHFIVCDESKCAYKEASAKTSSAMSSAASPAIVSPDWIRNLSIELNFDNKKVKDLFNNNNSKLKKIHIIRLLTHDNTHDNYIHTIEVADEVADEDEDNIWILLVVIVIVMFIGIGVVIYLINTKDKETTLERNKLNNSLKNQ
jgi:hypothetical protein